MSYTRYTHLRCLTVIFKGNLACCSRFLPYFLYGNIKLIVKYKSALGLNDYLDCNSERLTSLRKSKYNSIITHNQTRGARKTLKDFFQFKTFKSNTGFSAGCEWETSKVKSGLSDGIIMSHSQLVVGHDQMNNYFYIKLDENASSKGKTARLEYAWLGPNLVDMYHTEVPPAFRGQGVAKILAMTAFDYFSEKNVRMRPSCTYLQKYLKDNPIRKYLDHVENGFKEL